MNQSQALREMRKDRENRKGRCFISSSLINAENLTCLKSGSSTAALRRCTPVVFSVGNSPQKTQSTWELSIIEKFLKVFQP